MISNKCTYALKAILELAMRENDGPVTIHEIAQSQSIPPRFLEAILRQLKQAGFTDSHRGKDGGYFLAVPAKEISVGDILRLIEGPLVATSASSGSDESATEPDVFSEVWTEAEAALGSIYNSKIFKELAEKQRELAARHVSNYSI